MARRPTETFSFQVHEGGDRTLDGLLRLIGIGEREDQLEDVLTAMCADVAAIAAADVASVYVHEEGPEGPRFTMRGNVGFPPEALGRVHLRPGEGITGFAADRLRPVSVAVADRDERFKYISGLGEERFPALLAVPVLRGGAAVGVLVLQRSKPKAFSDAEVVLATALAAVINHAIERGMERERRQASREERRAVRLGGTGVSPGTALGQAEVLPTLAALAREAPAAREPAPAARIGDLLKRVETQLRRAMVGAEGAAASEMASLSLILQDERFRGRLASACASEAPLRALSELARAYARVPFAASSESAATTSWLGDRAAEIEDLCVLAFAATGSRPLVRGGTIVVAERLGLFSTLHAISAGASGFVVDGGVATGGAAVAAVAAAGRPLLADVSGVFSWLRPDDLLVVDADAGILRINPNATTVARYRSAQR
jgi:phosphotransferase system enzyme I (PtsP)